MTKNEKITELVTKQQEMIKAVDIASDRDIQLAADYMDDIAKELMWGDPSTGIVAPPETEMNLYTTFRDWLYAAMEVREHDE